MGKGCSAKNIVNDADIRNVLFSGLVREVESMADKGDRLACDEEVTVYDALSEAGAAISLEKYLLRWARYSGCSTNAIAIAASLITRSGVQLTSRNKHRLAFAALSLATKTHDDIYYSNTMYSGIGGLSLKEFNRLEVDLIQRVNWETFVSCDEYNRTVERLSEEANKIIGILVNTNCTSTDFDPHTPIQTQSCVGKFFSFFGLSDLTSPFN
eukprot:TRINITY_DN12299_c0_g1_i1.p1 TRINITY_DN12299_c0_g1~~TRINITY_DN12299_c0_g1_i1.p1  ORF type:complete len:212 (+),score=26.93 TRINITY_DN12299_c0_g1_i1:132-767(+)